MQPRLLPAGLPLPQAAGGLPERDTGHPQRPRMVLVWRTSCRRDLWTDGSESQFSIDFSMYFSLATKILLKRCFLFLVHCKGGLNASEALVPSSGQLGPQVSSIRLASCWPLPPA